MIRRLAMFLICLSMYAGGVIAQTQITGTVVSQDDNEPVIGASILVVGTTTGTVTDVDGRFSIALPEGKNELRVQYVGMKTQVVKARNGIQVVLQSDSEGLDEVIVTGYGNFRKSSFTGAAATMDPGKLEDVPVVSLESKIAGSIPGVTVSQMSGAPGAVNSIRVRGMGSINAGNDPLYVIDGTPVTSGNMSEFNSPGSGYNDAGTNILTTLNSNDIESITVIKDAAAASLYGSRAANGVIVITTKSGKQGKTHVDFRSDWGFSNVAINYRPILSGDDRRELLWTGLKNYGLYQGGMTADEAAAFADENIDGFAQKPATGWTDWKDLLFKTGHHQNYQVAISGGNEKTNFYTSASYTKQDGILENQGLERFTGNANLTHRFGRFTLNLTSQFSKMNQSLINEGTSYDGPVANYAFFQNPATIAYNEDGTLAEGDGFAGVNPLYEAKHSSDKNTVVRTFNTLKLTWNIWDNLNLSEKIAYDYASAQEDVLWDRYSNNGAPGAVMQRVINHNKQLNTQTQLTYVKNFGEHNVDALLGFETENNDYDYNYIGGQDYPGDLYEFANAGTTNAESKTLGYKLTSFLGRVNYNYANRYYAGLSYRSDGSSRLARKNRWGNFWSISGAWRFGAEKFFEPVKPVVTDGKLRLSYGVNGTQPSGYYSYMSLYKYGEYYNGQSGMGIVGIGNPDLKWEKNKAFNLGIDLTFIDRISVTFDYYVRRTSDLIYDLPVSAVPGYYDSSYATTTPQNIGELKNSGVEFTIQSNNITTKDFTWTTMFNIGHNSNKVVKLNGESDEVISGSLIHRVGEPYYSYYAYEYAGVDPETGKESYYINDGTENARNTTTNVNEANRVIIGHHDPAVEGGLSNNIRWKFIDFGFTFTYSFGGDALDTATWLHDNGGQFTYYGNTPSYYKLSDMWTGPGDTTAKLPKFEYGSTRVMSSRWLMPTDYVRLKSLTFGLSAPEQYISRFGLNKARFYFAASNLFTIKSKDLFVDPEMPVNGLCTFETPSLRTFTFGIELGF
ncbi:MAG: TonB-dependent receptor [Prevotella sp.]|nr:TonB-dependent receptor [Prevotella sp.]